MNIKKTSVRARLLSLAIFVRIGLPRGKAFQKTPIGCDLFLRGLNFGGLAPAGYRRYIPGMAMDVIAADANGVETVFRCRDRDRALAKFAELQPTAASVELYAGTNVKLLLRAENGEITYRRPDRQKRPVERV